MSTLGKPKFTYNDVVNFELEHNDKTYTCVGKVYIVDKWGCCGIDDEPCYDVMVEDFLGDGQPCLVKHIRESDVRTIVE